MTRAALSRGAPVNSARTEAPQQVIDWHLMLVAHNFTDAHGGSHLWNRSWVLSLVSGHPGAPLLQCLKSPGCIINCGMEAEKQLIESNMHL